MDTFLFLRSFEVAINDAKLSPASPQKTNECFDRAERGLKKGELFLNEGISLFNLFTIGAIAAAIFAAFTPFLGAIGALSSIVFFGLSGILFFGRHRVETGINELLQAGNDSINRSLKALNDKVGNRFLMDGRKNYRGGDSTFFLFRNPVVFNNSFISQARAKFLR